MQCAFIIMLHLLVCQFTLLHSLCSSRLMESIKRYENIKHFSFIIILITIVFQGSDTRVCTQKNPVGFFGYIHLKKPTPKKPTLLL